MRRSSGSIGRLAAALAKAQGELTNPEKSLVGTIPANGLGGADRMFRYASLSSGLDIVRKVLGQHEIATMQTTAIDQAAGIVNLTTVLAHASGEWIASDWPVCAVADTATPQRMGAALTYARRYALFTLVGIAGEDDLDAPDLITPTSTAAGKGTGPGKANSTTHLNGGHPAVTARLTTRRNAKPQTPKEMLGAEASAALRDRLIVDVGNLASADDAALWAHRSLSEKNKLAAGDAHLVEQAFEARLGHFPVTATTPWGGAQRKRARPRTSEATRNGARPGVIDKSVLTLPEPRRIRDRDHVKFVATRPCLICGRQPSDAHHLRFAQSRALGKKVSDEFTVPMCRGHHREVHRCGDEAAWWKRAGINPTVAARALWLHAHPLPARGIVDSAAQIGTQSLNYETKPIENPA
ncbi:MAG: ERF family protein [Xanthobacteraceae bacterium]